MIRMSLPKIPFFTGSVREQSPGDGTYHTLATCLFFSNVYVLLEFLFHYCCRRQTFVKSLEPFVKWLEEAEEEE